MGLHGLTSMLMLGVFSVAVVGSLTRKSAGSLLVTAIRRNIRTAVLAFALPSPSSQLVSHSGPSRELRGAFVRDRPSKESEGRADSAGRWLMKLFLLE